MAGISSPGIGSGIDVNSIVSQLMAIESRPLLKLDQDEAEYQAEISALGALKSVLADLQGSLEDLKTATPFLATTATSADSEVFTASTGSDVVPSTYDVTVNRLAQRHKLGASEAVAGATFGGTAGDDALIIASGSSSFVLDLSSAMTLDEIQEAINVSENETGISAGIITGDSGSQTLVFTAGESGYANRVQVSFAGNLDDTTFGFTMLNRDDEGVVLADETELDASLLVDGVTVTRNSNSIDDVVEGLTLDLQSEGRANVTITQDTSVAKNAINAVIEAYNGVRKQLSSLSEGSLSGNRVLISVKSQIRNVLNHAASGLGEYRYISELGVTTAANGDLELDSEMLVSALKNELDSVTAFFADGDEGFAARLDTVLDNFLQSGGVFDNMIKGVNGRIDDLERRRESLEYRLEKIEQRYYTQFTALDGLVAQMTTTSNYLSSQLDMLAGIAINSRNSNNR